LAASTVVSYSNLQPTFLPLQTPSLLRSPVLRKKREEKLTELGKMRGREEKPAGILTRRSRMRRTHLARHHRRRNPLPLPEPTVAWGRSRNPLPRGERRKRVRVGKECACVCMWGGGRAVATLP
jgi:hypothetical protein